MGDKVSFYVEKLKSQKDWDNYLMKESGLPGPRGNLELAQAFAEVGNENLIKRYLSIKPAEAPVNSAKMFLTFCGVVGLGTLINNGKREYLPQLRVFASDQRWRIREGVAMALQRVGDFDMAFLLREMKEWSTGNFMEKRAAAAALCEPRLLTSEKVAGAVLDILDEETSSIVGFQDAKDESYVVLKKGLAYCWSVAVVAYPEKGKKLIEKWVGINDKTVAWIMKENLKKNRMVRVDKDWVASQLARLNP